MLLCRAVASARTRGDRPERPEWAQHNLDSARVEDKADHARKGPLPESNSVCVICFGDLKCGCNARGRDHERYPTTCFGSLTENKGDPLASATGISAVLKSVDHLCEPVWTVSRSLRSPRHTRHTSFAWPNDVHTIPPVQNER